MRVVAACPVTGAGTSYPLYRVRRLAPRVLPGSAQPVGVPVPQCLSRHSDDVDFRPYWRGEGGLRTNITAARSSRYLPFG
jgi:hypothetical protein